MGRERKFCLVGCWLLGAVVAYFVGAAAYWAAILILTTPVQREFFYGGAFLLALTSLTVSPLGGWGSLAVARRLWDSDAEPYLWGAALLGYFGAVLVVAPLVWYLVVPFFIH